MKKSLEDITGTLGVGCLFSLGLFFLTDSQFRYWSAIEGLMETKSWSVLVSIPILIVNYIFGIITIELGEIIIPKLVKYKVQKEFQDCIMKVVRIDNELLTFRYNEVHQNKRILNGSSVAFILISFGVFLEGIDLWNGYKMIGIIGMVGSLIVAAICPLIGLTIQAKYISLISGFNDD